jgi:hypothetical protein
MYICSSQSQIHPAVLSITISKQPLGTTLSTEFLLLPYPPVSLVLM